MLQQQFLTFRNIPEYVSTVVPFLEQDETQNGLFLGALDSLKKDPPAALPVMVQFVHALEVRGAGFYRDRNMLLAGDFAGATQELASHLVEEGIDIPSAVGPCREMDAFAEAWAALRKCECWLACKQGLYRLTEVIWPAKVDGNMRLATSEEIGLIYDWLHSFQEEAVPYEPFDPGELRRSAERRVHQEMTYVWESDGRPVAMASLARPSRKGITVNAVYTPPELRRHGYASALVAGISNEGLKRGKDFCILYTDMSNPTSNSIYQKVGYKLVSYSNNYRFKYHVSGS